MSRIKSGLFILSVCMILGIVACKKESDPEETPATKTELLTSSVWKYDTAAIDMDNNGTTDTAIPDDILGDCDKDNTFSFAVNGSGTADEGATKCDNSNPQSAPFTWAFMENETRINLTGYDFSDLDVNGEAKIVSLTDTQLVLSKAASLGPLNVSVIITLKH